MFEVQGLKAQAELVYDALNGLDVNEEISVAALEAATGVPLTSSRQALYRAVELLQERNKRTLVTNQQGGYRVPEAREHAELAKKRRVRARRQIVRGLGTIRGTDMSRLTAVELVQLEAQQIRLDAHDRQLRAQDKRLAVLERAQSAQAQTSADIASKVATLEAQLAALKTPSTEG